MAMTLARVTSPKFRGAPITVISDFILHLRSPSHTRDCHRTPHGLGINLHQANLSVYSRSQKRMVTTRAAVHAATAVSAAASATAGGYTLLSFTPLTAVLGGLLLGIATAGKLLSTGRVLGISGAVKGLVTGDLAAWRFTFLLGMGLGSVALAGLLPGAFEVLPQSFPIWRAALAGLLVGFGSALGNGCTSGHGICGSARLSPRSFAYTATFMGAGMLTATLTGSAAAIGVAPLPAALAMPTAVEAQLAVTVAAGGVAAFAALAAAQRLSSRADAAGPSRAEQQQQQQQSAGLELGAEALAGFIFALGLGLSGMTRPSKVAGFLTLGVPSWDASLPFVMGGAVVVAMIAFQGVMRFRIMQKPLFCPRFQIPSSNLIDARLLAGGVLFGAGWGLAGMCPGPALVAALTGDPHVLAYLGAMVAGMGRLEAMGQQSPAKTASS
ncbi:hypothetical protein PLESTM_000459200 [Pleodorina starrii]|nr:hypothetical protein PLESTM_000459200 [Pleodorina starrii]